ncbi:hypothetical protein H310_10915 [Aphanomyces invadans]|uniref:Carboxypeptidase n=1 Tax=Aphanomyces invadans TaxID=157072 RepID=A0A024TRC3_9STRA|nr:hypothetical protein H310_10915 [Aphanomyces invadans]ETV95877.1 hypothetical protein H310_10915 [Aphanomyces invadans]|eukprot:XP_008875628.1 hypothetical protein H310_10915 [Aphanomyces invadans]
MLRGVLALLAASSVCAGGTASTTVARPTRSASMTTLAKEHFIADLPNYRDPTPISFAMYAGRMPLPSNGQEMFYWYVESKEDPDSDPLVLWLNGGPGCSSLGGFFTELGPFVVESDLTVKLNPYTWNRKANVVFLESPAGVGFSRPHLNLTEYNDDFTTDRIAEFLEQFLITYPSLQNRPLYITGESYAGIYIPYLVHTLVTAKASTQQRHRGHVAHAGAATRRFPTINLQGYAIGNPFTDADIDGNAYMDYYYAHALISMENYNDMVDHCEAEIGKCMYTPVNCSAPCQAAIEEGVVASDTAYLNPYYIYGDVCLLSNNQAGMLHFRKSMAYQPMHRGKIEPCTDKYTENYLNLAVVQEAIHVTMPGSAVSAWADCNMDIAERYHRALTALPKYRTILKHNLSALIYSGDADAVVNFIGTERWIASPAGLHLPIKEKWKSWFGPDNQLAGYTQEYPGLTFKTVKGAGHMVPAIRPLHALYMFECFIYGNAACANFTYPRDNLEYLTGEVDDTDNLTALVALRAADVSHPDASTLWTVVVGVGAGIAAFVAMQAMSTAARRSTYSAL